MYLVVFGSGEPDGCGVIKCLTKRCGSQNLRLKLHNSCAVFFSLPALLSHTAHFEKHRGSLDQEHVLEPNSRIYAKVQISIIIIVSSH